MFDFAFDHTPIGIAVVNTRWRIQRGNDAFSKLVGIPLETLNGTPFADVTHPDDLEADMSLFREVLAGLRDGYAVERRYVRLDRSIVHVLTGAYA